MKEQLSFKINEELIKKLKSPLDNMNLDINKAVKLLITKILHEQTIPFDIGENKVLREDKSYYNLKIDEDNLPSFDFYLDIADRSKFEIILKSLNLDFNTLLNKYFNEIINSRTIPFEIYADNINLTIDEVDKYILNKIENRSIVIDTTNTRNAREVLRDISRKYEI